MATGEQLTDIAPEPVLAVPRQIASRGARRGQVFTWIPVAPFFLYVLVFLLLPAISLVIGAFQTPSGSATLENIKLLFTSDENRTGYLTSVKLSAVTALLGGVAGFFVAYAAVKPGAPRWIRPLLTTFAGVAANFAGIPLAFAWVATIGTTGIVTTFLNDHGFHLYQNGFTLYSFLGLALVYTYFQLPLMILVISPALDGLRREWNEAATNLGASAAQYWRWVALPILWPSILGAVVLLFGNAFAAYATATSLVGDQLDLVPILIGRNVASDFGSNPQMANALSLGMIVIITVMMFFYALLQRRSSRWLR